VQKTQGFGGVIKKKNWVQKRRRVKKKHEDEVISENTRSGCQRSAEGDEMAAVEGFRAIRWGGIGLLASRQESCSMNRKKRGGDPVNRRQPPQKSEKRGYVHGGTTQQRPDLIKTGYLDPEEKEGKM